MCCIIKYLTSMHTVAIAVQASGCYCTLSILKHKYTVIFLHLKKCTKSILRLFYKYEFEWRTSKLWYKSSQLGWHSAWGKILCTFLSFLLLLTWTGSALTAHPDLLSPDAFDHISATVNRSVPPPPEISWHIKAPEGGSTLECTTKMWDPRAHSQRGHSTLKYLANKTLFVF